MEKSLAAETAEKRSRSTRPSLGSHLFAALKCRVPPDFDDKLARRSLGRQDSTSRACRHVSFEDHTARATLKWGLQTDCISPTTTRLNRQVDFFAAFHFLQTSPSSKLPGPPRLSHGGGPLNETSDNLCVTLWSGPGELIAGGSVQAKRQWR